MKLIPLFTVCILFTGCISAQTPEVPRQQPAQSRARPPIFAEDKIGVKNVGLAGMDAQWAKYGAYLQRLIDSVQISFDTIITKRGIYPPTGTVVTIKFRLEKTGAVSEIISAESSDASEEAKSICKDAIASKSPYGKWTDRMIAALRDSQEFTWKFYFGSP